MAFYLTLTLPILYLFPKMLSMRFYQGLGYSLRWFLKIIVGIDYKAQGLEHLDYQRKQGPCIIASKHQSMWETIMLSIFFPRVVVVLKKELLRIPIYGQYLKRLQSIAIDRKNGISAIRKIVHDGQKAVKIGRDLLIFPEGTRSNIGDKVSYQVGVAILYEKLGVNVLPVALNSGIFWPRRQTIDGCWRSSQG